MYPAVVKIIAALVTLLFADDLYPRIKARVAAWEDREIAEEEWAFHGAHPETSVNPKKSKVLHELKIIGINVGARTVNLLIELAVTELSLADKPEEETTT